MRVLIVDDETFLAELVKLALEADGHECVAVRTVEEAGEALRSFKVDLLALDLVAGGRDPLDWLEEVALTRPELRGRIFLLTGNTLDGSESERVVACGARVMPKPFTLHGLREAVTALEHAERRSGSAPSSGGAPIRSGRVGQPISEDP